MHADGATDFTASVGGGGGAPRRTGDAMLASCRGASPWRRLSWSPGGAFDPAAGSHGSRGAGRSTTTAQRAAGRSLCCLQRQIPVTRPGGHDQKCAADRFSPCPGQADTGFPKSTCTNAKNPGRTPIVPERQALQEPDRGLLPPFFDSRLVLGGRRRPKRPLPSYQQATGPCASCICFRADRLLRTI